MGSRGAALFITFLLMLMLAGLATAVAVASRNSQLTGRSYLLDRQAFHIAEAGLQRARQALTAGTWVSAPSPGSTYGESFGTGEYSVTIIDNDDCGYGSSDCEYDITSNGYVPNDTTPAAQRQVTAENITVSLANTNLSLSATATASSQQVANPATNANDGNTGTFWRANTQGSGEWLQMDYGASQTVNQIVIEENANIAGLSAVQYSSDGSSWTGVPGLSVGSSGSGNNQTWTADFTATGARYFRVTFTSTGSSQRVSVEESESYDTDAATLSLDTNGEFGTSW